MRLWSKRRKYNFTAWMEACQLPMMKTRTVKSRGTSSVKKYGVCEAKIAIAIMMQPLNIAKTSIIHAYQVKYTAETPEPWE